MSTKTTALKILAPLAIIALVVLIIATSTIVTVGPGERGVLVRLGAVQQNILSEGIHLKLPIDNIVIINVKTQKDEVNVASASKDLQTVQTTIALNYNLDPNAVNRLWREVGRDYNSTIISPAIQEAIKATTAKYTAEQLITQRSEVRDEAKILLVDRLTESHIHVTNLSIVDFSFSDAFDDAIEAKVTAEQNALAAKNKLEQIKFEAEQRIEQARGEAEAIRIQAEAIQAQGGKEYVQLKAIEKWDGKMPQYTGGDAVPFININSSESGS